MKKTKLAVFEGRKIRRLWDEDNEKWWFSVIDVVQALSGSSIPRRYWSDLKSKLSSEGSEVYEKIVQLKLEAPDGKLRATDVIDTENLLRLVQSIPSPKAEPFKLWLARIAGTARRKLEKKTGKKVISRLSAKGLKLIK